MPMTISVTMREISDIYYLQLGCLFCFYFSRWEHKPERQTPLWGVTLPTIRQFNSAGPSGRSCWCGEDFAQAQMRGQKGDEPQHAQPEDDIKVLVDPVLRLLVVESVEIINVDGKVGIGRMRSS